MIDLQAIRRAATGLSLLVMAFSLWAARDLPRLATLPAGFPRERIAYPARLDSIAVGSPAELAFLTQSRPVGSTVEVRSGATIHRARLEPQLTRRHFLLIVFEGLVFFAVNLLVFCPRLDRGAARDFYWCTLLYGAGVLVNGVYMPRGPGIAAALPSLAWIACVAAVPVFFLHMTLCFPRRSAFLDARPWVVPALACVAVLLFSWQSIAIARYVADPAPGAWTAARLPRALAGSFLVATVAIGCLILYRRGSRLELAREREQTTWLLWGFMVGVTPYVFLRTLPALLGLRSPLPPEMDRVFELAIPLAFTLAVVRYRFLDIDIIVRRSLIYGILAGVLAGVYLLAGVLVGNRLIEAFPRFAEWIRIVSVAIPVALFAPTRRWIGRWVDRTYFKIRHDFRRALGPLAERLRTAADQAEIADTCLHFLERTLLLRAAALVTVTRRGEPEVAGDLGDEVSAAAFRRLATRSAESTGWWMAPASTSRPDLEAADFPGDLLGAGVRVAVPLATDGRLLGAILLGVKATERRFIDEDLELIRGVREEAVAALRRVELVQIASEEAMEREKVEAVDRFRKDLFARVAHDLRTPLTAIRYTTRNLIDGIGGAPAPGQMPGLHAIHAATTQLKRLTDNLLDLSRIEAGSPPLLLEPVTLAPLVEESLEVLGPLAVARRVRLEFRAEPGLEPVRGDPSKLQGIVGNLVENAIRFSPDGSAVEIDLRRAGAGGQELVVRDHGPGIVEQEMGTIFERFRQGRRSPHSSEGGFGIGLFVARSYAEMMGGAVTAANHPQGGAEFRCALRTWEGGAGR